MIGRWHIITLTFALGLITACSSGSGPSQQASGQVADAAQVAEGAAGTTPAPVAPPPKSADCDDEPQPGAKYANAKECLMAACATGDRQACSLMQSYNGNLDQSDDSKAPPRLEAMNYFTARKIILSYGWKPLPGSCGGGGIDEAGCAAFPEVGNCQGTGPAYCDMHFARANRCLDLVTKGGRPRNDGPGDAHVDTVRFSRAPCKRV